MSRTKKDRLRKCEVKCGPNSNDKKIWSRNDRAFMKKMLQRDAENFQPFQHRNWGKWDWY